MLFALLFAIHLDTAKLQKPPVDSGEIYLEKVEKWVDTVGHMTPGINGDTKAIEKMHLNEKGPYSDPFPTYFVSPFRPEHMDG